ncbi:MAG: hypothetical protein ACRDHZ_00450, partial [Ktedonobacteraceae bacterium]
MTDEIYYEYEDAEEQVPFSTRAGIFTGAMAMTGIVDLAGHLGGFGIVGGTFLAVLLTAQTPQIVALRKKLLPQMPESLTTLGKRLNNRLSSDSQEEEWSREEYNEAGVAEFMAEWKAAQERTAQENHSVVVH